MKNIYIALTEKDINDVKKIIRHDEILLTDLECTIEIGEALFLSSIKVDEQSLVAEVSDWFREKSCYYGFSYGHVNQFYQCSIRPIIKYIEAIKYTISHYGKKDIQFFLPARCGKGMATSVYYLAEYESNGVNLYNRTDFLLPYIKNYLVSRDISFFSYREKTCIPIQRLIYNPLRLFLVFIYRLISDLKRSDYLGLKSVKLDRVEYDRVYLVRSSSQAVETFNWLKTSRIRSLVVLIKGIKRIPEYELIYDKLKSNENVDIIYSRGVTLLAIVMAYSRSIFAFPFRKANPLEFDGLLLNLNQALREILVMDSSLRLYEKTLHKTLRSLEFRELISFEQKSPQAFVDSAVAEFKGSVSFQVQTVQQEFFDLPCPVFADYFLCETPIILRELANSWSTRSNRLRYVGTIGNCENKYIINTEKNKKIRIIVFLSVSMYQHSDENLSLLNILRGAKVFELADVVIKLHPRDTNSYNKYRPYVKIIKAIDGDFCDFIREFDIALTVPSAIIKKLLFSGTPFLVYSNSMSQILYIDSFLPDGMKIISSPIELVDKLNDVGSTIDEHHYILKRFISSSNIVLNTDDIDSAIEALAFDSRINM